MRCHVDSMQRTVLNNHVSTLDLISYMDGRIQRTVGKARQFPRIGLMDPSVCYDGWMKMGMGGMCKVNSTPFMPLHFLWVCYGSSHSAQLLHLGFAPVILLALCFLKLLPV
jgi:hypothetical protein